MKSPSPTPAIFTRMLLDAFHGDNLNIPLLAQNGPVAIMLKATQGSGAYVDPTFKARMLQARAAGMLVGSYHFADGSNALDQVRHWFDVANPQPGDAVELDWENNVGNTATAGVICVMVAEIFKRLGRYPLLYGSDFLRERIPAQGAEILFKCPLSLASYNTTPVIPDGWDRYTLWQYTGDGQNAKISPHTFPGAESPLDVYQFDGTIAELRAQWPFGS